MACILGFTLPVGLATLSTAPPRGNCLNSLSSNNASPRMKRMPDVPWCDACQCEDFFDDVFGCQQCGACLLERKLMVVSRVSQASDDYILMLECRIGAAEVND